MRRLFPVLFPEIFLLFCLLVARELLFGLHDYTLAFGVQQYILSLAFLRRSLGTGLPGFDGIPILVPLDVPVLVDKRHPGVKQELQVVDSRRGLADNLSESMRLEVLRGLDDCKAAFGLL